MKKIGLLLLSAILILNIFSIAIVQAQEDLPPEIEKIQDVGEKLQEKDSSYLAGEWTKLIAENKYFGWLYKVPFKRIIGIEFSISWKFLIILAISIALFILFSKSLNITFKNNLLSLAISFAMILIIGNSGALEKIFSKIEPHISSFWHMLGLLAIIGIIVYTLNIIMKIVAEKIKKSRDEKAKSAALESKRKLDTEEKALESLK